MTLTPEREAEIRKRAEQGDLFPFALELVVALDATRARLAEVEKERDALADQAYSDYPAHERMRQQQRDVLASRCEKLRDGFEKIKTAALESKHHCHYSGVAERVLAADDKLATGGKKG